MQNTTHLQVGHKIGNHYEILKVPNKDEDILGQGGFGIVYLVRDIHNLNKLFVVKELFLIKYSFRNRKDGLTVKTSNKKEARETFQKVKEDVIKEVNILSTIKNKNIVQSKGYIEENNTIYSIMEYIDGTNLEEYIQNNSFSEKEAINLLRQIIHGLKEIHQQNIIHRDIKPSNIMRTKDGLYILIDFTTSKTYSTNKTTITGIGTKGYAPPELERTKAQIGEFSDIYSIGMTIFRLLSLKEPPIAIDRLTSNNDNSFLEDINSLAISNKLKNIIKKMTAIDIEKRFKNLEDIEKELDKEPPPPTPYLNIFYILVATIAIGYLSYYFYGILPISKVKNPNIIVPKPDIIPPSKDKTPYIEEASIEVNITQKEIPTEPKIKLLNEVKFDKDKMINNLEDRDILTLTKNSISFSFEESRLIFSNKNNFSKYKNKLIWKLKNPKCSVGLGLTKELKKQQFASKIALGMHKKKIHLVITLKDGYSFKSEVINGYKIISFKKDIEKDK